MNWYDCISNAIKYIEDNLDEELKIEKIAQIAYVSPFYFQKIFSILSGFTVGEYIRNRRLAKAGEELYTSNIKIIDLAIKYGYDSPDSFTKAFTRFHGSTPTSVRKNKSTIKSFTPLILKFILKGGNYMNYKIIDKDAFKLIGSLKTFRDETSTIEIPKFWDQHYENNDSKYICGVYGVCIEKDGSEFDYMIADDYNENQHLPEKFKVIEIPKSTWVIFPCLGPMPKAIQETNQKIFSEWLPNHSNFQIACGYNIEYYSDVSNYENGNQDENYYTEIWIPIKNNK